MESTEYNIIDEGFILGKTCLEKNKLHHVNNLDSKNEQKNDLDHRCLNEFDGGASSNDSSSATFDDAFQYTTIKNSVYSGDIIPSSDQTCVCEDNPEQNDDKEKDSILIYSDEESNKNCSELPNENCNHNQGEFKSDKNHSGHNDDQDIVEKASNKINNNQGGESIDKQKNENESHKDRLVDKNEKRNRSEKRSHDRREKDKSKNKDKSKDNEREKDGNRDSRNRDRDKKDHKRHSSKKDYERYHEDKKKKKTGWDVTAPPPSMPLFGEPPPESEIPPEILNYKIASVEKNDNMSSNNFFVDYPSNSMPSSQSSNLSLKNQNLSNKNSINNEMCRIYVGSLDYNLTEEDIKKVFSAFGTITIVDMPKEPSANRSKGFCFVEYANKESADVALQAMHGFQLKGRTIKVGRPTVSGSTGQTDGITFMTNSFFNPPPTAGPTVPTALTAGALAAASLLRNKTGIQVDPNEVLSKISATAGPLLNTAPIRAVTPAFPRPYKWVRAGLNYSSNKGHGNNMVSNTASSKNRDYDASKNDSDEQVINNKRIHVYGIPLTFSKDDVKKIFDVFGKIVNLQLESIDNTNNEEKKDNTEKLISPLDGRHNGCGFIEYSLSTEAHLAFSTMNGFHVADSHLRISFTPIANPSRIISPPSTISPSFVGESSRTLPSSISMSFPSGINSDSPINPSIFNIYNKVSMKAFNTSSFVSSFSSQAMYNANNTFQTSNEKHFQNLSESDKIIKSQPASDPFDDFVENSNIMMMTNIVDPGEVDNDLKDEIQEECQKYGDVKFVYIHVTPSLSEVRIFVTFSTVEDAKNAVQKSNNRWFAGKRISCSLYNPVKYSKGIYD